MKKKLLMVLKMAAIFSFKGLFCQIILFNILLATAPSSAQNLKDIRISISVNNITVEKAFQLIEEKTNFKFNYIRDDLPMQGTVNIDVDSESLYNILTSIAKDYSLVFKRVNEQITVRKAEEKEENIITSVEAGTVKGKVTDEKTGEVLVGASVALKGTTLGAYTDSKGFYEIDNVKLGKYTVVASYVGYTASAKGVTLNSGKTVEINFQLGQGALNLDEVVVTGSLSERSIKESANPISIITPKDLQNRNLTSLSSVLQTVPGIVISSNMNIVGQPGRGSVLGSLSIRGYSPYTAGNYPFKVILDGVELANADMITYLDPNAIEKIEVARGPMSTTLYGAGSSSGVISIFTKKGIGALSVNFRAMATSQESKYQDSNPLNTEYTLSLKGSKGDMTYNVGLDYSLYPINRFNVNNGIDEQDWSVNAGISGKIDNLFADLKAQITESKHGFSAFNIYRRMAYDQGWSNLNSATAASLLDETPSDQRITDEGYMISLNLKHIISDNIIQSLNVGYSGDKSEVNYFTPSTASDNSIYYLTSASTYKALNTKYYINWKQPLADLFKLDLTGGFDYSYKNASSSMASWDKPNDDNTRLAVNTGGLFQGEKANNITTGLFAEGMWGYNDNLFLTTGIRAEKNNSYGEDLGWYTMPRVGLTYVATVGDFSLKPRVSWGKSSQPVSPTYKINTRLSYMNGNLIMNYLANPGLKPQTQSGWEYGADVYLTSNFSIGITYYDQTIDNLIKLKILDFTRTSTGFVENLQWQNVSKAYNKGWEIGAMGIYGPFTLDVSFTALKSTYGTGVPAIATSSDTEYHEGGRINGIPSGSFVARLTYTVPAFLPWSQRGGNITFEYVRNGEEYNQDYVANKRYEIENNGEVKYYYKVFPAYTFLNLRGDYSILNNVTIFFDVKNLLNNQDIMYSGPLNGRTISFGTAIKF
jgi:outer membrane receptor protein involved in Fe transport